MHVSAVCTSEIAENVYQFTLNLHVTQVLSLFV